MIFTSSFNRSARNPKAVAICRGLQPWYTGRVYDPLRPSWAMLKLKGVEFNSAYRALLETLDPHKVAADVGDGSVMLCWEHRASKCHRSTVAAWLRAAGYDVAEVE